MDNDVVRLIALASCDRSTCLSSDDCLASVPGSDEALSSHCRARADRSLAALAEAGGFVGLWRTDMENAPRDRTRLLLSVPHRGKPGKYVVGEAYWDCDSNEAAQTWWWANEGPGDYCAEPVHALNQPTAWAALPAPPGEKP